MLIFVLSYRRPHLLKPTMESIFKYCNPDDKVVLISNAYDEEIINIVRGEHRLYGSILMSKNVGINRAYEIGLDSYLEDQEFVMTSEDDVVYKRPFNDGVQFLKENHAFNVVSYYDSPEHKRRGTYKGWIIKGVERGCALILRRSFLDSIRPLPKHKMLDYDWFIFRDSQKKALHVAATNAATHIGEFESTWNK